MAINWDSIQGQDALFKGIGQANALLQTWAKTKAGSLAARGDIRAAQQTLQRQGMMEEAHALSTQQNELERQAYEAQRRPIEDQQKDERFRQQSITWQDGIDDEQKAEASKMVVDVATALDQVYDIAEKETPGSGVSAATSAFEQLAPIFQSRGATDEQLQMYREQLGKDPKTFLTAIAARATEELESSKVVPPGGMLAGPNGEVLLRNPLAPAVVNAPNQGIYTVNREAVVGGGAAPPASIASEPPTQGGGVPAPVTDRSWDGTGMTGRSRGSSPDDPGPSQEDRNLVEENIRSVGGTLTNNRRSVAKNGEVGGAVKSAHLGGYAWDVVPARGQTMAQLAKDLNASGLYSFVYNEGDHVHVERYGPARDTAGRTVGNPGGGQGAAVKVAAFDPKPEDEYRTVVNPPGYAPGTVLKINTRTNEPTVVQQPTAQQRNGTTQGPVKLSPQDNKELQDLRKQADQAQASIPLIDEFISLNKNTPTGSNLAWGTGAVVGAFNGKVRRMQQIQDQLTPAQRQGLPGAASDKDVAMFRNATLGIDKPGSANLATAKAFKAWVARQQDFVAFMDAWAAAKGNLLGAREAWRPYAERYPVFGSNISQINRAPNWRTVIPITSTPYTGTTAPASSGGAAPARRRYVPGVGIQ